MCGIAGYNCSREWANEYLTVDKQQVIFRESLLHNLHRGWDATGYFASPLDGSAVKVYKKPGSAVSVLDKARKANLEVPISTVFGAHTRGASVDKGDPDINSNNHPVTYGNVIVTHNGFIKNDEVIKNKVKGKGRVKMPEVDSVAIAIVLDKINDPRDTLAVGNALAELDGNFAIHALWRKHPSVSVFARGYSNPLIMAYNEYGCMVYGSEEESIWSIINNGMGLNPSHDSWTWRKLDTNKLVIFDDGVPISWGTIPFNVVRGGQLVKVDHTVERILPAEGDRESLTVYSTDSSYDFAVKEGEQGRNLSLVKHDRKRLTYTRSNGFVEKNEDYPRQSDSNPYSVASEADSIIINSLSGCYHIFIGSVEIIMSPSRVIQDIYNHDLFETKDRWKVTKKSADVVVTLNDASLDWDDFYLKKTTKAESPDKVTEYAFKEQLADLAKKNQERKEKEEKAKNNVSPLGPAKTTTITPDDSRNDIRYLSPMEVVSWETFWSRLIFHDSGDMFFMTEGRCKLHGNQAFDQHTHPTECANLVLACAYALTCFDGIDIPNSLLMREGYSIKHSITTADCQSKKGVCWYIPQKSRRVEAANDKYFDITSAEECFQCGNVRWVDSWPTWLEPILQEERSLSVYAY